MSYPIELNPCYAVNPERVFVVTGYHGDSKAASKAAASDPVAHYVIAPNDLSATQVVVDSIPNFIPMGCINLKELKRFVVEMEAVRLGVKKPLGISESVAAL